MVYTPLVLFHACNATIGLISGYLAMFFPKGSNLHRLAGNFFFISMLNMSGTGLLIATFFRPNMGNVMGGALTFYLVATAWVAGKRREKTIGAFDWIALVWVSALGIAGMRWGFEAMDGAKGGKDGYPAPMFFVFGIIALLFAAADVRMLVRRGVSGTQRIVRHLWRMCLALLMATVSLYPGQAKLFSPEMRQSKLIFAPHIFLIGATIYWLIRMAIRKRAAKASAAVPTTDLIRKVA